jgi:uncharacterized protein DUF2784
LTIEYQGLLIKIEFYDNIRLMSAPYNIYILAADTILLVHFAFIAFVILGFAVIWIGYLANRQFVRHALFRITHMLAMGFVFCESAMGRLCPLTEWENELRISGGQGPFYETSFIQAWIYKIMYFDISLRTFSLVYGLFLILILFTLWKIPPERKLKSDK